MEAKAILEDLLTKGKQLAQQGLQKGQDIAPDLLEKGRAIAQEGWQKGVQLGQEYAPDLMEKGKVLAQQGLDFAEKQLGIPEEGPDREAMLSGLSKGALAGGLLAVLLGTKGGRRVTGTTLKLGSLTALGGLAYQAYQRWETSQDGTVPTLAPGQALNEVSGAAADQRSQTLLKAIIAAAKADGHIDDTEKAQIQAQIAKMGLGADAEAFFQAEVAKPLSAQDIARSVTSTEEAMEVYLASRLIIDVEDEPERAYLNDLATQLKLDAGLVSSLEAEVTATAA